MAALRTEISTEVILDRFLNGREHPSNIARSLGVPRTLISDRLRRAGATHDPRAAEPFSDRVVQGHVRTLPLPIREPGSYLEVLDRLILRDGRSLRMISDAAGVDYSYLSRLRDGRRNPSALIVERICEVLRASEVQTDQLHAGFGLCPPSLTGLKVWPTWLTAMIQGLALEQGGEP